MAEIYYTETRTDENGEVWYYINGSTGYNLSSGWTKEDAEADYLDPDSVLERDIAERRAWGFYD